MKKKGGWPRCVVGVGVRKGLEEVRKNLMGGFYLTVEKKKHGDFGQQ